jgi:hypothetical protein
MNYLISQIDSLKTLVTHCTVWVGLELSTPYSIHYTDFWFDKRPTPTLVNADGRFGLMRMAFSRLLHA